MKSKKKKNKKHNKNNKNNIFRKRIKIISIILSLVSILILYKIYTLQIKNFKKYSDLSKKNYTKLSTIIAHRGLIFDRKNIILAENKYLYKLITIPNNIKNIKSTIFFLKKINFNEKDINNFKKKINQKQNNIYILKNQVSKKELNILNKYKKYLHGIYIIKHFKRHYLYDNEITHVIGYANQNYHNNITGRYGIEKYYNNILKGKNGYKKIILNNIGKTLNISIIKPPIPGKNINLTINIKLQKFIFNLLKNNISSVIVSNPDNGEILSLVSTPSYNINLFTQKIPYKQYIKIIKNKNHLLVNKVIQGIYPPASTIKPYIMLAALKENIVDTNYIIFDPGWWKINNSKEFFYDWKKNGHGLINIKKSIEESSDTFYYQIAYKMGIKKIIKWIKKFGYGQKTNIDLPNENKGIIPEKIYKTKIKNKTWFIGDTISIGIGQGYFSVTPIQIHNSLLIFINKGKKVKLHLLMKVDNKNIKEYKKKQIINIKQKYWNLIKESMYGVVHYKNGTAYKNFLNTKYKLAAKSGTAQVYSLKKYNKKQIQYNLRDHTLMNTLIPYKKPKFAITIVLEHGGNGLKVGDIMRKITDYIYKNKDSIY